MSSVQWIGAGAMPAQEPAGELVARPARAAAPWWVRRSWEADFYAVLLVLAIIGLGVFASVEAVAEYRWEKAAYAAFKARHAGDLVVLPVLDLQAREHFIDDMAGGALFVALEVIAGLLLRRHSRSLRSGERQRRQPRKPRRGATVVVTETFRDAASEPKPRAAAAERAATVVWGDRVARHEAAPGHD